MAEASRAQPTPPARPWRALVADDSTANRVNLGAVLQAFDPGIEVVEAGTGRRAYEILVEDGGADIAFVNLALPDMTGAEALAYARARNVRPFTILTSNQVLPRWVEVSAELDAYEFLKKPFDAEHIAKLLTAYRRMREPLQILLVDDSSTARQLMRRVLQNCRFALEIEETDAGQHALKLLRLTRYDIALIDFQLEGIDGLEVACQAREIAADTTLILMSASDNASLAQGARHFGITSFLKKPFYARDVDFLLHNVHGLRRPYLLNAMMRTERPAKAVAAAR